MEASLPFSSPGSNRGVTRRPAHNMSSSSPPSACFATGLRPAPAGVRSSPIDSSQYFASLRGLFSHPSVSRVLSVSFRQRPVASPFAGRLRLPSAARSSGDPAEINVDNVEGTRQSLGSSTGSGKDGKESTKSFSSKEFYFAPAPGKMGYGAAVERFVKLMAMVWAGSQVTKILQAGGALALAPFVDRGLRWFTVKFNFKSEGRAFATIVGLCFAIAALLLWIDNTLGIVHTCFAGMDSEESRRDAVESLLIPISNAAPITLRWLFASCMNMCF